jgi:putative thioredoxin
MSTSTGSPAAIFDTNSARFVTDVIERSRQLAVAVDFWAPWCAPCRALAPILEQLVNAYGGRLAVARINTDEEPALAAQFGIRSIPDVRVFRDGRQVDGFVGVQPMPRLKMLFDKHVPRASEGLREQAHDRLRTGDAAGAVALLRKLLADDPENTAARIDLAEALTGSGDADEAERILDALPPNVATSNEVERVRARIHLMRHAATPAEAEELRRSVSAESAELPAMHKLAAYEMLHGDASRALELLLAIMQRDRRFEDDLGRRSLLHAFRLLGDADERVADYRRRMTRLLY